MNSFIVNQFFRLRVGKRFIFLDRGLHVRAVRSFLVLGHVLEPDRFHSTRQWIRVLLRLPSLGSGRGYRGGDWCAPSAPIFPRAPPHLVDATDHRRHEYATQRDEDVSTSTLLLLGRVRVLRFVRYPLRGVLHPHFVDTLRHKVFSAPYIFFSLKTFPSFFLPSKLWKFVSSRCDVFPLYLSIHYTCHKYIKFLTFCITYKGDSS